MGRDELSLWEAYVTENGPLNLPLRIESAIARIGAPFLGKSVKPRDLMVWPKEPEPEATPENVLLLLRKLSGKGKK